MPGTGPLPRPPSLLRRVSHGSGRSRAALANLPRYLRIVVTWPVPTVRSPSWIEKCVPACMGPAAPLCPGSSATSIASPSALHRAVGAFRQCVEEITPAQAAILGRPGNRPAAGTRQLAPGCPRAAPHGLAAAVPQHRAIAGRTQVTHPVHVIAEHGHQVAPAFVVRDHDREGDHAAGAPAADCLALLIDRGIRSIVPGRQRSSPVSLMSGQRH
jgi:hypothetical protein